MNYSLGKSGSQNCGPTHLRIISNLTSATSNSKNPNNRPTANNPFSGIITQATTERFFSRRRSPKLAIEQQTPDIPFQQQIELGPPTETELCTRGAVKLTHIQLSESKTQTRTLTAELR